VKYATVQLGRRTAPVLVHGEFAYDLSQAFFRTFKRPFALRDLVDFLEIDGPSRMDELDLGALKNDRTVAMPARRAVLRAPVLRPPKIICVGLNYREHAKEQNVEPPKEPLLFAKAANSVIGPEETIRIPAGVSDKVDPEVELAVVIGKAGYQIRREDAWTHVFGFTIMNDVTARDIQKADRQWFRGKSFRTFAPLGPVVIAKEAVDISNLEVRLRVNGQERQKGSTSDLIFDIPRLLEYASACFELEVGDILSTGTPSGVGVFRNPPVFLKPGDVVEAEIQNIGVLRNPVE
jgi:2-keto-4-pentenoate hydratase/2-oxohepta-3-ene-1,7-dioic acid hydratase in catechol pathway